MKRLVCLLLTAAMLLTTAYAASADTEPAAESETQQVVLSDDRLASVASIKKLSDYGWLNLYSMEIYYDYSMDDLILPAGEYEDITSEYQRRLMEAALPGLNLDVQTRDFGCSAFTLAAADGKVYMGRNYDFKFDTSAMQLFCHPKDGYSSVSYCALDNLSVEDPLSSETAMATCLACPFVCLDGMNEKGVAIATLTVPSDPVRQDTGKPILTTASIIRLVLDHAASTEEAIELISQYDMCAICGRDYHFYITDASGDGRIVEYDLEKEDRPLVVTPIRTITNYYGMHENKVISGQKNGKYGTGKERREKIESEIARAGENTCKQTAWAALKLASTAPNPESLISNTQWIIVYNLTDLTHEFVLHRRWSKSFAFEKLTVTVQPGNALSADRLATLDTIEKLTDYDDYNVYSMDVLYDYSLKNLTPTERADSQELMNLIFAEAAPGYNVNYTAPDYGCSTFCIPAEDGSMLMGRNYDFRFDTSCMIVHCKPWDGYESVAHAALNNVGADDPDSSEYAKVACLTAPFICIDGINEKGVGIAVLTEDSEPVAQDTGKPVLGTTVLIRLVLDKAATTDEALKLFEDYDMFAIAGRDYHFFITDRSGKSVTVEFDPDSEAREMVVLPARSATNFYNMYIDKVQPNQKNGHYGHGFERFTAMEDVINAYGGTGSSEIAWEALKSAVQEPNPESITSNTQWSIIYNLTDLTYELVPRRHWDNTIFNDVLAK